MKHWICLVVMGMALILLSACAGAGAVVAFHPLLPGCMGATQRDCRVPVALLLQRVERDEPP